MNRTIFMSIALLVAITAAFLAAADHSGPPQQPEADITPEAEIVNLVHTPAEVEPCAEEEEEAFAVNAATAPQQQQQHKAGSVHSAAVDAVLTAEQPAPDAWLKSHDTAVRTESCRIFTIQIQSLPDIQRPTITRDFERPKIGFSGLGGNHFARADV